MKKIMWCFVAVVALMFTKLIHTQLSSYERYAATEEELRETLEREKRYTELITKEQDYFESDAYIEKIAREVLGYVRPDETIFVNGTQK